MLTQLKGFQTSHTFGPLREYPWGDWHKRATEYSFLDFNTLVYDVGRAANGNVILYCPRLFNLRAPLMAGLRSGYPNIQLKVANKTFGQWERLEIKDSAAFNEIRFVNPLGNVETVPVRERFADFDGRNVLLTMNKDNPISWIVDWIDFHKIHHQADAVLIFDNGSTAYDLANLERELIEATGLKDILIVDANFPYGQSTKKTGVQWRTIFIQTACLNLAKEVFLRQANAVLSIDIDEFVEPIEGSSVFEITRASLLGMLAWRGTWAYTLNPTGPMSQKEHTLESVNRRDTTRKWCVDPKRLLGRSEWMVHGHFGLYGLLISTNKIHHWHFRHSNTAWKGGRLDSPTSAHPSTELAAAFAKLKS